MHFEDIERVEYKHNILFEVVFQARFPDIMKISKEDPAEFQDIVRKEGYPEFELEVPLIPQGMPKELEAAVSTDKTFRFFSEERDWQISLAKNFIALSCTANYRNYEDFSERLKKVLEVFCDIYEPSYFTRIGLRYRDIANKTFLPPITMEIEDFIPEYIFPELSMLKAEEIKSLEKVSRLNDGDINANVVHVLSEVSGKFGKYQVENEKSYIIDVDCFVESRIEGINNVVNKCNTFKRLIWNIFQWSITDKLRGAMGSTESSST